MSLTLGIPLLAALVITLLVALWRKKYVLAMVMSFSSAVAVLATVAPWTTTLPLSQQWLPVTGMLLVAMAFLLYVVYLGTKAIKG